MVNQKASTKALHVFLEQMVADGMLVAKADALAKPRDIVDANFNEILRIARDDMALARVLDESDLILHAEGEGATHDLPWLRSLNWLTYSAESGVRKLFASLTDIWAVDGKNLARQLDLRIPAMAPGSLWIGVKVHFDLLPLFPQDREVFGRFSNAMSAVSSLTECIGKSEFSKSQAREFSDDPAMLDAQLTMMYRCSPSGRKGIESVEISSPGHRGKAITPKTRQIIKKALETPQNANEMSLRGEVREADLDRQRMHIHVPTVGIVRCVFRELPTSRARKILGEMVTVSGHCERDKDGKPRLMYVERIDA